MVVVFLDCDKPQKKQYEPNYQVKSSINAVWKDKFEKNKAQWLN
jgi:hypothetical protein